MIIDKHAPIKSMQGSEKYCPWIKMDLKGLIRERDKLKKQLLNTFLLPSWSHTEKSETGSINSILISRDSICRKKLSSFREIWKNLGGQSNNY